MKASVRSWFPYCASYPESPKAPECLKALPRTLGLSQPRSQVPLQALLVLTATESRTIQWKWGKEQNRDIICIFSWGTSICIFSFVQLDRKTSWQSLSLGGYRAQSQLCFVRNHPQRDSEQLQQPNHQGKFCLCPGMGQFEVADILCSRRPC